MGWMCIHSLIRLACTPGPQQRLFPAEAQCLFLRRVVWDPIKSTNFPSISPRIALHQLCRWISQESQPCFIYKDLRKDLNWGARAFSLPDSFLLPLHYTSSKQVFKSKHCSTARIPPPPTCWFFIPWGCQGCTVIALFPKAVCLPFVSDNTPDALGPVQKHRARIKYLILLDTKHC